MTTSAASARRFCWVAGGVLFVVVTLGIFKLLWSTQAMGAPTNLGVVTCAQGIAFAIGMIGVLLAAWLWRDLAPGRIGWRPHLALQALGIVAVSLLRAVTLVPLQDLVMPPGAVFRGSLISVGMEQAITLILVIGIAMGVELSGALREREAQAAELRAGLSEARLQALSMQLQPHFLFNTLNAIATLLHRDPEGADTMLTRLSELLRATMRAPERLEVPLGEELAMLDRYLDIMRVRHGARLTVLQEVSPELVELPVPPFLLQPLVENALEHGVARRAGPATVIIRGRRRDGVVRLEVVDDGPGPSASPTGEGVGLTNVSRRLEQMYGQASAVRLEPNAEGGTRAVVELPWRPA